MSKKTKETKSNNKKTMNEFDICDLLEKKQKDFNDYLNNRKIQIFLGILIPIVVAILYTIYDLFSFFNIALYVVVSYFVCEIVDDVSIAIQINKILNNLPNEVIAYLILHIDDFVDELFAIGRLKQKITKRLSLECEKRLKIQENEKEDEDIDNIVISTKLNTLNKDIETLFELCKQFQENFCLLYDKQSSKKERKMFKICFDACSILLEQPKEKLLTNSVFLKQAIVYLKEFIDNEILWKNLSEMQKEINYENMNEAIIAFNNWVLKSIETFDEDIATSVRVSAKTLKNMLEKQIDSSNIGNEQVNM